MKKESLAILVILGILLIAGIIYLAYLYVCEDDWCFIYDWQKARHTNSFEECANRGFPVMESYPRQCRTSDERLFIEEIN